MAVKLHGLQMRASSMSSVHRAGAVPLRAPVRPPHPHPRRFRPPLTLGRLLYFALLLCGAGLGGHFLYLSVFYVRAIGVFERTVDRLAPRERGRILRIEAQVGQVVKRGQPLVWMDYAAGAPGEAAYLSESAARQETQRQQKTLLQQRRNELVGRQALVRASLGGLRARAEGLSEQYATLEVSQKTAARLAATGAATEGEVARYRQKLAELAQERAAALAQANEQTAALAALGVEAQHLDAALREAPVPAPRPVDTGVISASRDGVVGWVMRHPGEVVTPQDPVVIVLDEHVHVRAYVQPRDARSLIPGREARIELPTGESLQGEVSVLHLLTTTQEEQQLGVPKNPALPADELMPYMLSDVAVKDQALPREVAAKLVNGAPCEVRLRRVHGPLLAGWPWIKGSG